MTPGEVFSVPEVVSFGPSFSVEGCGVRAGDTPIGLVFSISLFVSVESAAFFEKRPDVKRLGAGVEVKMGAVAAPKPVEASSDLTGPGASSALRGGVGDNESAGAFLVKRLERSEVVLNDIR